jgi:hypothetical protein
VFADVNPATTAKQVDNTELRNVQAELERNGSFLKGLYESLICSDITGAEYKEMKQSYEAKIAALTGRERQLREAARTAALETARRGKAADNIGAVYRIADLTADVMDALIERILVYEDKRIEIKFKFTDETVTMGGAENE